MPPSNLREIPVLAVDCQATSSSAKSGHLIEIAWSGIDATDPPAEIVATTVALPDDVDLPRRIARLTGISPEELDDAPPAVEVRTSDKNLDAVSLAEALDGL